MKHACAATIISPTIKPMMIIFVSYTLCSVVRKQFFIMFRLLFAYLIISCFPLNQRIIISDR
jgi:hypothetical protein